MGLPSPVRGGGGSLGAIQAGMLRALRQRGITPDLVAGTSVGSVNGVADAHASTAAFLDELVLTRPGLYGHPGVPRGH